MESFIHELLTKELKSICTHCSLFQSCEIRLKADRAILQCDDFKILPVVEHSEETEAIRNDLCSSCNHRPYCNIPKEIGGTWKCSHYEG